MNQVAAAADKGIKMAFAVPDLYGNSENFIYNAMIAPLTPYAIKGAIWYQSDLHTLVKRGHCFQRKAAPGTGSYTWMDRIWEFMNHKGYNQ